MGYYKILPVFQIYITSTKGKIKYLFKLKQMLIKIIVIKKINNTNKYESYIKR